MLYSLNYIIPRTTSSCFSSKILKFTITLRLLILTYIGPISKLIILSLYSTSFPKIVTNRYRFFFLYIVFPIVPLSITQYSSLLLHYLL